MTNAIITTILIAKILSITYYFDVRTPFWTYRLTEIQTYSSRNRIPYRFITDDPEVLSDLKKQTNLRIRNLEFVVPLKYPDLPLFVIKTDKHVYKFVGDAKLGRLLTIISRREGRW